MSLLLFFGMDHVPFQQVLMQSAGLSRNSAGGHRGLDVSQFEQRLLHRQAVPFDDGSDVFRQIALEGLFVMPEGVLFSRLALGEKRRIALREMPVKRVRRVSLCAPFAA